MHESHAREIADEWQGLHEGDAAKQAAGLVDWLLQALAGLPEDSAWCSGEAEEGGTRPLVLIAGRNLWRIAAVSGDGGRVDSEQYPVLPGFCHLVSSLSGDADSGAWTRRYHLEIGLPGGTSDVVEFVGREVVSESGREERGPDRGETLARRLVAALRA